MKRYLFSLLTFIVTTSLCVCLTSCGDDDNDDRAKSSPLTGTWRMSYIIANSGYRVDYDFDAGTVTDPYGHTELLDGRTYIEFYFKGDGKGLLNDRNYEDGKLIDIDSYPIEYVLNNDKITIKYDSDFIKQMKKYADPDTDIEEMEKWEKVLTYDSENETIWWQEDEGRVYLTKK